MAKSDASRRQGQSDTAQLSYITDAVRTQLAELPRLQDISLWTKDFECVAKFHFMDLLTYPVYGRDKTFDMESMKGARFSWFCGPVLSVSSMHTMLAICFPRTLSTFEAFLTL
eukprot:scpid103476/ scgid22089/ 